MITLHIRVPSSSLLIWEGTSPAWPYSLIYSWDILTAFPQTSYISLLLYYHLSGVTTFLVRCIYKTHSNKELTVDPSPHEDKPNGHENGSLWGPTGGNVNLDKQDTCAQVLYISSKDCVRVSEYLILQSLQTFIECARPRDDLFHVYYLI